MTIQQYSEHLNGLLRMVANTCMFPTFVAPPVVAPRSLHNSYELNDHNITIMVLYYICCTSYYMLLLCNQPYINIVMYCDVQHYIIPNTDIII